MNSARKVVLRLLGVLLAFLVLLAALELILPRMINLEPVQRTVFGELRDRLHCETDYDRIDFTLFPRPHLIARDVRIWKPEVFQLSLKSMTLFPELGSLFSGEIRIREILFVNPDIHLTLPPSPADEPQADSEAPGAGFDPHLARLSRLEANLRAHMDFLRLTPIAPVVEILDGRLVVFLDGEVLVDFNEVRVHGERRSGQFDLTLGSEASFCERVSLRLSVGLEEGIGSGQLIVSGLNIEALGARFLRNASVHLGSSLSSLVVQIAYHEHRGLDIGFHGEIPELTLEGAGRSARLAGARFDAKLALQGQTARFTLASLQMASPQLQASGSVIYEGRGRDLLVEVTGTEVDAAGVREVALGLWGEDKGVRDTFEVVLGGHVPHILYRVRGRSLKDLRRIENTSIEGIMEGGRIYIPPARLLVENARGEVKIHAGVLTAWNLEGRTGDSLARGGVLVLALKKDAQKDGPFHLDIQLDADLSAVPPVLQSTVKDPGFLEELELMEDVQGRAVGRLVLGERLKDVKTFVQAAAFNLRGRYRRVPHSIDLKGTGLTYEGRGLSVESLAGSVGRSVFESFALGISWGSPTHIEIQNHHGMRLDLDEIYPWVLSHPPIQQALEGMDSLSGVVHIRELSLNGPLMEPGRWSYHVEAQLENATLLHRFFPDRVRIKGGRLQCSPGKLALIDCESAFLDAAVNLSGSLGIPNGRFTSAELQMSGSVASGAMGWVFDRAELPDQFRIRGPVTLSDGRFSWNRDRRVAFSGGVIQAGGRRIDLDLRAEPGELDIRSLVLTDRDSRASLSIFRRESTVDFTFEGQLLGSTLDRLLVKNELLEGSVRGGFQITFLPKRLMSSTAKGFLEVEGLRTIWNKRVPLEVQQAVLRAEGNGLRVQSAQCSLGDSTVNLTGAVDWTSEGYRINLDVDADVLVWETLNELREREWSAGRGEGSREAASAKKERERVSGAVRVKANRFHHGRYVFSPLELRIDFRPEGTFIDVSETRLCGISCPSRIEILPQGVRLSAEMKSQDARLDASLRCLWGTEGLVDGSFDLTGSLSAEGPANDLLSALQGRLDLKARDGRIFPIGFIGKVFSVLNITEIYRGQLPDLASRGCAYDSMTALGTIEDGILSLDNAVVDAHCMKMVWRGSVDLKAQKADLIVVVAPLRTVDRIIDKVPLLGDVLGGSLISFPVRVSGDLRDPDVVPLSPTALGAGFMDFLRRAIRVPLRLTEPLR